VRLSWEEWEEDYKPLPNHLDDNASYDGFMFETYEPEYSFVKSSDKFQWTLIEVDGTQYIIPGLHHVNRLGYFLTEEGYHGKHELIVDTDDIYPLEKSIDATVKYMESIIGNVKEHGDEALKMYLEVDLYEDVVKFYNENIR